MKTLISICTAVVAGILASSSFGYLVQGFHYDVNNKTPFTAKVFISKIDGRLGQKIIIPPGQDAQILYNPLQRVTALLVGTTSYCGSGYRFSHRCYWGYGWGYREMYLRGASHITFRPSMVTIDPPSDFRPEINIR